MDEHKISQLPNVTGDTYFDTSNETLMVFDGSDWATVKPSTFTITDSNGDKVFEITHDGEVIWHAEPTEAARVFCDGITFEKEREQGFKTSRQEWQASHKKSIYKALEDGELTKEKLDEIFAKHEFHGKLKGDI